MLAHQVSMARSSFQKHDAISEITRQPVQVRPHLLNMFVLPCAYKHKRTKNVTYHHEFEQVHG